MVNTRVSLNGITLDNPVIAASGTFGYGHEFAELYDINCLGTFSFKGTTREPRYGNPTPRIAECPSGLINAGHRQCHQRGNSEDPPVLPQAGDRQHQRLFRG